MLQDFALRFREKEKEIQEWLDTKRAEVQAHPVYASVDLRNAGFKVAPVDTNLFPAGWNNLCPSYQRKASEHFRKYFDEYFPGTKCLLILPEDHTRNLYYFSNIKRLQIILQEAGFDAKIGSLNPEVVGETRFQTQEGEEIVLHQVYREGEDIFIDNKRVCQIIVNNDFSAGIPDILQGIRQFLLPPPQIGWHTRKKSDHFQLYNELIEEFSKVIGLDGWFFKTHFSVLEGVDFDDAASRENIAVEVEKMLGDIRADYQKFQVNAVPSIFIKNNSGTYGLGVLRVNSGDEVRTLNQKNRKQMRVGKGSVAINSIILQEGIPTVDRVKGLVAEPVVYLVGNEAVGGFYRLNSEKGDMDNLNSKGMQFSNSCLHDNAGYENLADPTVQLSDLAQLYKVIGAIASLAAGREILAKLEATVV